MEKFKATLCYLQWRRGRPGAASARGCSSCCCCRRRGRGGAVPGAARRRSSAALLVAATGGATGQDGGGNWLRRRSRSDLEMGGLGDGDSSGQGGAARRDGRARRLRGARRRRFGGGVVREGSAPLSPCEDGGTSEGEGEIERRDARGSVMRCARRWGSGARRGNRSMSVWRRHRGRDRQEGVRLGLEGGAAGPWAGLALGQMGCGEAALFSLSLLYFLSRKIIREKKKKERGFGKEFAHGGNFPGLAKICSFQEK